MLCAASRSILSSNCRTVTCKSSACYFSAATVSMSRRQIQARGLSSGPRGACSHRRTAREPVERLAHPVRRRNQEVNIAPVEEIELIRLLAGGLHGPPHAEAFSYPFGLPECHIAP
jgi:hypothetical protein